jgi:hypothetical protein
MATEQKPAIYEWLYQYGQLIEEGSSLSTGTPSISETKCDETLRLGSEAREKEPEQSGQPKLEGKRESRRGTSLRSETS